MLTLIPLLALAPVQSEEMRLMRFPAVHGEKIAFTYASDLWIADKDGGFARRLTSHPGDETRARFSPDGKWIAFSASYDGNPDVYVIPSEGGEPKRLTFDPNGDNVIGWTPEGKIMYTSITGNFTNRQARLWLISPQGGMPEWTVLDEISDGTFFGGNQKIAYNRVNSHMQNWRRYRGGRNGRISIYDFAANTYRELPNKGENSWFPMIAADDLFYISDRELGTVNLYRHDVATGKETRVTNFDDADMKWPSTDGKTIVFERDGWLWGFDVASGKTTKRTFQVRSDALQTRPYFRRVGAEIQGMGLSPSGVRVAIEARGDIFSVPAKAGDTRNLTETPGARERNPRWSPDGKVIAFTSDKTGDYQIYTVPQSGGVATQVSSHRGSDPNSLRWSPDGKWLNFTTHANDLVLLNPATKVEKLIFKSDYGSAGDYDWSPDSKWIAYVDSAKTGMGRIFLYEVATGKSTQVTDGYYDDNNVAFDLSGKYLYFSSARTFTPQGGRFELSLRVQDADRIYVMPLAKDTPNPLNASSEEEGATPPPAGPPTAPVTKVDFEGLADRAIVLPPQAGSVPFLAGLNEGVLFYAGGGQGVVGALSKFDLKSREVQPIMVGGPAQISFNPNRTKMAYVQAGQGGAMVGVIDIRPGNAPGAGRVDTSLMEMTVDPRAEWKQIFWEAWRYQRDNFYDPDMGGLDWRAIGQHYEQYLSFVRHRSELTYVLGLMIGELGTSHAYTNGPGGGPDDGASAAMLGVDYDVTGNNVRFKKIYRGSSALDGRRGPLGEPGVSVNEGDYLLEIDGRKVDARTPPGSLLLNKANRFVTLTVNSSASLAGARKVRVRPIGSEVGLRYHEWVEETRKAVAKMSGGRIGYIHYPSTGPDGQIEFIRGYWSQTDKDAVILDGRWNSGGYIQPFVVPTIGRKSQSIIVSRNNLEGPELAAINGPKAMLTNYLAGSGGDLTPWMFKNAGYGPVIGSRSLGGLVGIAGQTQLMDGGTVSSPEFGFIDPATGEWIAENSGVSPDIPIDRTADTVAQGRDVQLEKAVEVLMAELKKQRPANVKYRFPRIQKKGGQP